MWEVRGQFSKRNSDSPDGDLEWSAVFVDTEAEAEVWWKCRTASRSRLRSVATLFNPKGEVVRVLFK